MNKILLYLSLFITIFSFSELIGQEIIDTCGTIQMTDEEMALLPWYGNNEYLTEVLKEADHYLEREGNNDSRGGEKCREIEGHLLIPVRFWIYRDNIEEAGLPNDKRLQEMMDELNRLYQSNGMNVRFFMICPQFITDATATVMGESEAYGNQLNGDRVDAFAINVHIVRDYEGAGGVYNGFGDFIVVERNVYSNIPSGTTTLAHEIGHYFGLQHTHRNSDKGRCRQESVSRTRTFTFGQFWTCGFKTGKVCNKNGDALCDTAADPQLSGKVDILCQYTENETDEWGDTYVPDPRNIMSYASRRCRFWFSPGQVGVMWYNIWQNDLRKYILTMDANYIDPDQYEPDNSDFVGVPRLISIGEKQCHSFYNIEINGCVDEVDWLRIDNSNGLIGSYIIEIDDIDGFFNPVEDVLVWNTDINGARTTEVATIISTDGTTRIFEVLCSEITNDFLIEVVRTENNKEGLYTITLNNSLEIPTINGESQICINNEFTIENIPDEATVEWSASSNLTINTTGNTLIVSGGTSSNFYWIQALITFNGCSYVIRKNFEDIGGLTFPSLDDIAVEVIEEIPCYPEFIFSIPNIQGATNYKWSCSSNSSQFIGCFGDDTNFAYANAFLEQEGGIWIEVSVRVTNECGALASKTISFYYEPNRDCGDYSIKEIRIVPNPVVFSEVTVEIIDNLTEFTTYRIIITDQLGDIKYDNQTSQKINQLNMGNLPNGIYAIHVIANEEIVSESFIIQR